uniref:NADH-ubiquinone oxidoreductase chain 1 n=1 Tax=Cephalothrix simula TaxID=187810 RepID=C5HYI7_9BILA|nr:NADH dehydrogenase subunit 1 [Cephalothrix simula]ACL27419.1 NADH dehydrogenase subunit 1 [Cephalothrix simula]
MFCFISFLVADVFLLICVAFYTLLERKVLGYIQLRKGPNKVGIMGLPQPLADALKLFLKEQAKPVLVNQWPYIFAPIMSLILSLGIWSIYPSSSVHVYFPFGVLFFLCLSSLSVYGTLIAGWSSNSKYALLGSLRAVAQTISYEVSMVLVLLSGIFIVGSFNFFDFVTFQKYFWVFFISYSVSLVWVVTTIAETNRAPFDFAEGESELVSGFNVEYSGGGFALIFMAEYASILIMSLISSILFFGGSSVVLFCSDFFLIIKTFIISFFFLWVRGSLPRLRYDLLMDLTWKSYLPFSLGFLFFVMSLMMLLSY